MHHIAHYVRWDAPLLASRPICKPLRQKMLRKTSFICILCLTLLNTAALASWEGGFWAHDYPEDVSIYGYFRLHVVPANNPLSPWLLMVDWVESRDKEPDLVSTTKQVKEVTGFFESPVFDVEVEDGGLAMGTLKITNSNGKSVWFQSHELGKYKIVYDYDP